ncbi:MAG: hypothetical protein ACK5UE_02865 [Chitinophagales bacterium]|jgi:hypothetical protein|nr:hypothetical protein [Sphingobacteriales bacterium]
MVSEKIAVGIKNSEFKEELEELVIATIKLKKYSSQLFVLVVGSIFLLVLETFIHRKFIQYEKLVNYYNKYEHIDLIVWFCCVLFASIGIFILFNFQKLKRSGMIVFEELTDELDWSNKRKEFIRKPPIEARIVIKDFIQNTDLPFTVNGYGQIIYLVFFIVVILTSILIQLA